MRTLLSGFVFALLGAAAAPANAMPFPSFADQVPSAITLTAGGCGIGFHRGPYGGCRPNGYGYGVVGVPAYGYGGYGYGYPGYRYGYHGGYGAYGWHGGAYGWHGGVYHGGAYGWHGGAYHGGAWHGGAWHGGGWHGGGVHVR
jgi:hypothetical protein